MARVTTLVLLPGLDGTEIFLRPPLRALPGWIEPLVANDLSRGRNDSARARARRVGGVEARLVRVPGETGARDRLRRCRAPVLYVAGTRDTVVPHHKFDEIVRELPATTVAHLEGEHLALDSNPEAAARMLSSWIEEVERRVPVEGHRGGAP